MALLARLLLVAVLSMIAAGCAHRSPFVGSWTFDPRQSELAGSDLVLASPRPGWLHSEGGGTAAYELAIDGAEGVTANGRRMTWRSAGRDAWTVTKVRDGQLVETTRVTLSADHANLTTATTGRLPDGSDYRRTTIYQRRSGGTGLVGSWRVIDVDTGTTWDGYIISRKASGVMAWEIPTDHQLIVGRFDGADMPITGPGLLPGTTLAANQVGERQLETTMKAAGAVSEYGTVTISADGRTMTELSWAPGDEQHKSKAVYVKQARADAKP